MTGQLLSAYFDRLGRLGGETQATDGRGEEIAVADAVSWAIHEAREAHGSGNKIVFIGNGGSAAIASHMAIDYTKNGGLRALAFNDGAALTCLGNDLGYENVFAKQIEMHGHPGDLLIAISSSGRSPNILKAVRAAQLKRMKVLTLSGFASDNPLRKLGDINLYLPDKEYGFVEIGHLMLCHAILDFAMGWAGTTDVSAAKTM
jgi:D-sedoheptulose 7-phosphate isomerase